MCANCCYFIYKYISYIVAETRFHICICTLGWAIMNFFRHLNSLFEVCRVVGFDLRAADWRENRIYSKSIEFLNCFSQFFQVNENKNKILPTFGRFNKFSKWRNTERIWTFTQRSGLPMILKFLDFVECVSLKKFVAHKSAHPS